MWTYLSHPPLTFIRAVPAVSFRVFQLAPFIGPSLEQEITDAVVEKLDGQTHLGFTRPANPMGTGKQSLMTGAGDQTILLWAFGPEENLGYHFEGRGAISVDLFCASTSTELETGAPTPSPDTARGFSVSPTNAPTPSLF